MIKTAVCDMGPDVYRQMEKARTIIPEIWQCDRYSNPESLIKILESGNMPYQIILMNMEWDKEHDWVKAAHEIRHFCPDTKLIYMAEHPERFVEQIFTYGVLPDGFLIKPIKQKTMAECFSHLIMEMSPEPGSGLLIRRKGRTQSIDFKKIIYLESAGHLTRIHTQTGQYDCYERLQRLSEQLPEYFIQCHKSYVVNMRRVRQIGGSEIIVETGEMIPISKSRRQTTRRRYADLTNFDK